MVDSSFITSFIKKSPDISCIANTNGRFEYVNDVFESKLGYSKQELTSQRFFNFVHPEDEEATKNVLEKLIGGDHLYNFKNRYRTKEGSYKWFSWNACIDQESDLIYATARDLTDQINRQQALIDQLEQANKDLEAFSYSVSHDLRTPLRAITGFSQILLEDYADDLDKEGQRLLQVVIDNTYQMGDLIDDILSFSRISRSEPVYTTIDLASVFKDATHQILQGYPELAGKTNVTVNDLPKAEGDLALLKQVALNLISNAVKYSSHRENIEIEIGALNGQDIPTYYVSDNGIGFDMQYTDKLFGVFERLHNSSQYEGTGVGLSLVKRIIDSHGGDIWAESAPDNGATFYFQLSN